MAVAITPTTATIIPIISPVPKFPLSLLLLLAGDVPGGALSEVDTAVGLLFEDVDVEFCVIRESKVDFQRSDVEGTGESDCTEIVDAGVFSLIKPAAVQ